MRLLVSAVLAFTVGVGCSSDRAVGDSPDAADPTTAPDAGPVVELDCSDLDDIIDLDGQVAANANANRGLYPIVLSHGFFGFDSLGPLEYFNGSADALREAGFAAYLTAVEPIASTDETRGPELGRQIACIVERSGSGKVNLVGHSQGGLDARFVASDAQRAGNVATVTTVATPHRGTVLADIGLGVMPGATDDLLNALSDMWGFVVGAPEQDANLRGAMEQMASETMETWNAEHPDNPNIEYFSWGGRSVRSALRMDTADELCDDGVFPNPDARDIIDPLMLVAFDFIAEQRGPNDGLVSVGSTKWATFMGCIAADHLDQVGLMSINETNPISGFNHREFFIDIAADLETRGY